ncbi:MAG: hypothetical protein RIS71_1413 [Actinomycetota bacterium]
MGCRDGRDLSDLLLRIDFLGEVTNACDCCLNCCLDATLQAHRVRACCDVAQTFAHHGPGEHGCRGRSVTGNVVGLLRDFLHQFRADALVRIFQLDLLGDRHTVIGDRRSAPLLVEHDVAALWSERHAHGIGQLVHAIFETTTGFVVKQDDLGHGVPPWVNEGIWLSASQVFWP